MSAEFFTEIEMKGTPEELTAILKALQLFATERKKQWSKTGDCAYVEYVQVEEDPSGQAIDKLKEDELAALVEEMGDTLHVSFSGPWGVRGMKKAGVFQAMAEAAPNAWFEGNVNGIISGADVDIYTSLEDKMLYVSESYPPFGSDDEDEAEDEEAWFYNPITKQYGEQAENSDGNEEDDAPDTDEESDSKDGESAKPTKKEQKEYAWACVQGKHEGPAAGIKILEGLCEEDAEACAMLGTCYQNGTGVEIDLRKAAAWYEKAVEKSLDPFYERTLASVYMCELDGELFDMEKCVYHAREAVKRGDQDALRLYAFAKTVDTLIKRGEISSTDPSDKITAAFQTAMSQKTVDLELEAILPNDGQPRYRPGDGANQAKMMALFRILTIMIAEGKSAKEIMEKTWLPEAVILDTMKNIEGQNV